MKRYFEATGERWLLPDAVDEFLPPQAEALEHLRRELLDTFLSWGYQLVIPPLVEYLDSLLVGAGNDLDLETFKLIDQSTGRLLGVRADITPQAARIDAHRLPVNGPQRLCYLDSVLRSRRHGFAASRNPLQVGAELYGHGGIESDIEILRLMVRTLRVAGIERFHIDLGHVGIFRALARDAGLDKAQEAVLFNALQRKARPEIESFLGGLSIDAACRRRLVSLVELNGGSGMLDEARSQLRGAGLEVEQALDSLRQMADAVQCQMAEIGLHHDLAELRGYRYQTGLVFAAFVPGHGMEVARGGRYDDIGRLFGRARPATGFSTDLKTLFALGPRTETSPRRGILAPPWSDDDSLRKLIRRLRSQGERVIYTLPGQEGGAAELDCNRRIERIDGEWAVIDAI
ncbi:MAG: ATP phosphoribosyltransferase regulatory subunit [Gammaproteobacteria bacterium]|jgi:ATP phosphoribosyltransferase regulatory subunit|nr:ATP phosphoribosyltransferase regulatory subunit [Gammaproteobacteria bacterium]